MVAIRPGGRDNVTQSHIAWRADRGLPEVPSPLYYRGHLYVVKNGGIVSCFDGQTGKLVYRRRLGEAGQYYASPVAGDGKVYVASEPGVVTVFEGGDTGRVLATNDLGERIMATPALVESRIYLRTAGHLWAFGE